MLENFMPEKRGVIEQRQYVQIGVDEMKKDGEYIRFDLVKVAEGMLRRLWMIILAMLLCGSMLFSYAAFLVTPMYESSVLMYVNNSSFSVGATSFSISSSEISAAKSLVDTYLVILKTRLTLNEVIDRGGLDCTYEELCKMISANAVNDTEVFSVTVTSDDPQKAEHIANTIAQVLPDKIAGVVEGSSVSIVDYAVVPSEKVSPSIPAYTVVGLLMGLVLSGGVIALVEMMDNQIRSETYLLENYENIPLLTVVPDLLGDQSHKNSYYYGKSGEKAYEEKAGKRRGAK